MINLKEVKTKRDLKRFVLFPFKLYKNNSCWVPPLISDELKTLNWDINPAFEYCKAKYWIVYKNGKPAGRIAGIINKKYIEKWKNRYARFGWIDFIDDLNISKALINAVEKWAKSNDLVGVHGPLGFTDFDNEGMLVEGFDELSTMAGTYNYPYYKDHIEMLGYKKDVDWVEYETKVPEKIPQKAKRIAEVILVKSKLKIIKANKPKDLLPYAHGIFNVIDESYKDLYGFVSLTQKQVDFYIKQYFSNIVTDYIKVVVDENDKVAGFVIGMPSLSRALQKSKGKFLPFGFIYLLKALRKNKYVDLYLGAVRPDLQGRGVDALLMKELTHLCIKNGVISVESNRELEKNRLVQAHWKYYDSRQHKRERCYVKSLLG